jgi:gamma-glutamyltranspeptidase
MKTFKQYLSESGVPLTRKQLMEGGNAIKTSSRINQLNVAATLKSIYKDLTLFYLALLAKRIQTKMVLLKVRLATSILVSALKL